ncbi:MAG: hypothetical protein M3441_09345 [Chloroflexota bacterium]|nr:hypothetical protein [Chloroflexota bacterium]
MFERDPYLEAHRKGPGFGLFIAWVITCVLTMAAGDIFSSFIEGYIPREGTQKWLNSLLTGAAIGAVVGVGQGLVLASYLGWRILAEWVLATAAGRVARIMLLVALTSIASGIRLEGESSLVIVAWVLIYAAMGALAGLVLGMLQSFVLERWVMRPRWWVLANVAASALVLALIAWLPEDIQSGPVTGALNGLLTGVITGIALNDLLKEPAPGKGGWLTWKRERPVRPSIDTGSQPSPEVLLEDMKLGRRP